MTHVSGAQAVSWTLLLKALGLTVALVGVVWGLTMTRITTVEERLLRMEAIITSRGERIAILEAARVSDEATITALGKRTGELESRASAAEISLASHRAATERRNSLP